MNKPVKDLLTRLAEGQSISKTEYARLLREAGQKERDYAAALACQIRKAVYGEDVYIRGLIEVSNNCKNDCYYCGIRKSNRSCTRYRLSIEEILHCCREGYQLGFRTFVLQGGEDGYFTDDYLERLIGAIKEEHPDVAITLSLGERTKESYIRLFRAGADRYLLRHETANAGHYALLHPPEMSLVHRMQCLTWLREAGFQVGAGMMVGSPYQSIWDLAEDLTFLSTFRPEMCGIGPFIPHHATPFANQPPGSVPMTLFLLSIIRLTLPRVLLPATTALGTLAENGMEQGMLAGANVVMPNLSPIAVRRNYELYNNKKSTGAQSAQDLEQLRNRMANAGFQVVVDRGDAK